MIQYIVILFIFYMITCIYGIPFQIFLENLRTKGYRAVTCPLYGLSIGMIFMFYLNCLEFSVSEIAVPLTVFFIIVDIAVIVYKRKNFIIDYKKTGLCCFIIAIVTIYFAIPGIVNNGGELPVILENHDFALYAAGSNAVKYHGVSYIRDSLGRMSSMVMDIQNRYIDYWIAYISFVFRVSIFNAASLISIYLYSLFVIAGAGLASFFFKQKRLYLAFGICFFFNCNFQYIFYQGFIGQMASISLIIMISAIFLWLAGNLKVLVKESISLGIFAAGLAATYGEMIPVVVLPMIIGLVAMFAVYKDQCKVLFLDFLIAAATVAIIFARGYYTSVMAAFFMNDVTAGWDIKPGYILQSIGLYNVHTIGIFGNYEISEIILFIAGAGIWLGMVRYVFKKFSGGKRVLLESYLISYGLLYFVFLYHYDLYKTFKAMLNTSYIFIVMVIVWLYDTEQTAGKYKFIKNCLMSAVMLFVIGGGVNVSAWDYACSATVESGYHAYANVIGNNQNELQKLLEQTSGDDIYISGGVYWDSLAALAMTAGSDVKAQDIEGYIWGLEDRLPDKDTVTIDSSVIPDAIRFYGELLLENPVYTVRKLDLSYHFCLNRQDLGALSFFGLDDENYAFGGRKIQNPNSELVFYTEQDQIEDVYFNFVCNSENRITIAMPDGREKILKCIPGSNEIQFSNVLFSKGSDNLIKIKTKNLDAYLENLSFEEKDEMPKYAYHTADFEKYSYFSLQKIIRRLQKYFRRAELLDWNGTEISFMEQGNYQKFIQDGLWGSEEGGLWTTDDFTLSVRLKEIKDICITWDGQAFQKNYKIRASCNGRDLGYVRINDDQTLGNFIIDENVLVLGENTICFKIENIVSPYELRQGGDKRQLGIFLRHITLCEAEFDDLSNTMDLSFLPDGNYAEHVQDGLWESEKEGIWTKDRFEISISLKERDPISITWDGYPFQPDYRIHVTCNGNKLDDIKVNQDQSLQDTFIDENMLVKGENRIEVQIDRTVSPDQLQLSEDKRLLGIFLRHIVLKKKAND